MTTKETNQLTESVFDALKNDAGKNFESRFKEAYGKAVRRMNLRPRDQSANLFAQVKKEVEKRLEQHAEINRKSRLLLYYFRMRKPIPLLKSEKSTLLAGLC